MTKDLSYIQKRLDSLHEIDKRIISFLDNMSEAVKDLQLAKQTNDNKKLTEFNKSVGYCFDDLSYTAIHLRREIKFLSDRMNSKADTDDFTMLPVQINKKATWVNGAKMRQEIKEMNKTLSDIKED
ncbi:hypothetical protein FOA43_001996 [Brettanomyces nanus]|uniref:Mediator of RNA polymerase II transcription subunit 11 n=1 Tax=Eeniella nana TaxID=13502 RepID=A0A875S640_EENNA|nr:uncharacterized protein FOA43_001996 [Brettanomyces nanus]QPG74664.1 hypothetical protein FOA43_001996 [Brettanomyces nanus]